MTRSKEVRLATPVHPGSFFRSKIIGGYDLSVTEAAKALGITRAALSAFINEHSALSSEMALRIEKAFGVPMDTLMRMQNVCDIAQARKREKEVKVAPFKGKRRNLQQPQS